MARPRLDPLAVIAKAEKAALAGLTGLGTKETATWDPDQRATYADRPVEYVREILGVEMLTEEQIRILEELRDNPKVLVASANNMGKTFIMAAAALWVLDARGSVRGPTRRQVGARVILPGPSHDTVLATIYGEMLELGEQAENRGYAMPPGRSDKSVTWKVRGQHWAVEAMSPPKEVSEKKQAHGASGRHHTELWIFIEEGSGCTEALWNACEGMASSAGNHILASSNPTEPFGPFFERTKTKAWKTLWLSSFGHPNVVQRKPVIPKAIFHGVVDGDVEDSCELRGAFPEEAIPDPRHLDFLYALPPKEAEDPKPHPGVEVQGVHHRVIGHAEGEVRVFRPRGMFAPRRLGRYAVGGGRGVFDPQAWDESVRRWREEEDPETPPDRIGVDPARNEGGDDSCVVPAWGEAADVLLRQLAELRSMHDSAGLADLKELRRIRTGRVRYIAKGTGRETALRIVNEFPGVGTWVVDSVNVGYAVVDFAESFDTGATILPFLSQASPPERISGEPLSRNLRAAAYMRAALLVSAGLVDIPDDPDLRQEAMAIETVPDRISVEEWVRGKKMKVQKECVRIIGKKELKKRLGRSPDRLDAWVLSLHGDSESEDLGEIGW